MSTYVLPGHRVEIVAPELTDGDAVEVFVVTERQAPIEPQATAPTLMEFLASLPPGPRSASTWEEISP